MLYNKESLAVNWKAIQSTSSNPEDDGTLEITGGSSGSGADGSMQADLEADLRLEAGLLRDL